ncbi:Retrotransposon gag domain [Sesbania bispinosa]|nr:Retrotransposon gag domain [Sesbania bispinosa]
MSKRFRPTNTCPKEGQRLKKGNKRKTKRKEQREQCYCRDAEHESGKMTGVFTKEESPPMHVKRKAELRRLLQTERNGPGDIFDLEPPLVNEVLAAHYPTGYQPPSFRKFNGTGNARKHLMCFLNDLGIHRDDKGLRLKEFSKSLAERAFTWYVKLRPRSIRTWEELPAEFYEKFLEGEGAIHIIDLGRVKQKSGESLVAFVKRYRDRDLQCKETLPNADLVYGCVKNIEDRSQIFLSLGGITTFAKLMRQGANVSEAMRRQGKRNKEAENVVDVYASEERERKKSFRMSPSPRKFAFNDVNELPRLLISTAQAC